MTAEAEEHLTDRLTADAPHRLAVFRLETELVEALKRIYYFAKRISRLVVDEVGAEYREGPLESVSAARGTAGGSADG